MLYIHRWFQLANQVTSQDEATIFYLTKDSQFLTKFAEIEELSVDEDFIPDDEVLDILESEHKKWLSYLNSLVQDFGDINSRFYESANFKVTPKVGLNLRDNPLTGMKIQRLGLLQSGQTISMRYWINGANFFNGSFDEKWAKVIIVDKRGYRNIGWVAMRYLKR